jgi:hypothetical protein
MLLTGEAETAAREHGEEWPEGEERAHMENDCEEELPQAIADISLLGRQARHQNNPPRRPENRPQRPVPLRQREEVQAVLRRELKRQY